MISVTRKRDLLRWFVELVILMFIFSAEDVLVFLLFLIGILIIEYQEYQLWKLDVQIKIINENINTLALKTKTAIRTKTREDF